MDSIPMYIGSGIGAVLIILGFIALLTQRNYIDPATNAPTEVEIPLLGKMKANYPALIFVFLGCVMVNVGLRQYDRSAEVLWRIDGTITTADAQDVNWQLGRLEVFPASVKKDIDPETGRFWIEVQIPIGKTLEDVIEYIDYTHPFGGIQIFPKSELELNKNGKVSNLVKATEKVRVYKGTLVPIPKPSQIAFQKEIRQ
jgi:hypothetical protein